MEKEMNTQPAAFTAETRDTASERADMETTAMRVLRDSESHSDNTPSSIKNSNTAQETGGETWKAGETWKGGETQDREMQKERETQGKGMWKKVDDFNENVASLVEKETLCGDIAPQPPTDADLARKEATLTIEAKSADVASEFRSQSGKRLSHPQSPGGKPHRSGSPRSRSPSQGRRTWLQERSATLDSASPQRDKPSSHRSRSSDSRSSSEERREKVLGSKSGTSERRHRSESSHRAESGGKPSHKEQGSSDHRSRRSGSRQREESSNKTKSERRSDRRSYTYSRSSSRDQSPSTKSRSDRRTDKKRHTSSDSSRHRSESSRRSRSEGDSQEKHHRSSTSRKKHSQSHHESRSHHRSESGRSSSSDHHSSTTKKKHKKSHHRSYTRSRSKSSRRSRSERRSSHSRSPRSSYDRSSRSSRSRSSTSKKKHSSKHKSRSKYKSGKHSQGKEKSKDRSSSHSKKSKHRHKRSKSSNKSKSSKHSSHKEKSSHYSSTYYGKQSYGSGSYNKQYNKYQTNSNSYSSKKRRSPSHSSMDEKSYHPRSYTPTEKMNQSRYKSESPRHRSTSPGGGTNYQRRVPQYGPQGQYGRTNYTPYMMQGQNRNPNYRRGGWTVHPNYIARNPQAWNNNNNNRNRIGFYRRPTWNNAKYVQNMGGGQRRYQQPWNQYNSNNNNNNNYQNRHPPRRWQSPLSLNYSRQYLQRPYSPSWDRSSVNSSPRRRSKQQSPSVSASPPPKRQRKKSPASASPYRSPAPSPKRTETPPAKRPRRSPTASPAEKPQSDSDRSVKKARSLPSLSPVELQNLRVVVDNLPPQSEEEEEEDSDMTPRSESPVSGSESPVLQNKPQDVGSTYSDDDDDEEPYSKSAISPQAYTKGIMVKKKDMTVDAKVSALKSISLSRQRQLQGMKNDTSVSDNSEADEDEVATYTVFDSSDEEENQPVSHRISVSSEESNMEMATQNVSDPSDDESHGEGQASPSMYIYQDSEESNAEAAGASRIDGSDDSGLQAVADSMSDSSEGEAAQLAAHRQWTSQSSPDVSPLALQARLLKKAKKRATALRNSHPSKRAAVAASIHPHGMLETAGHAHLASRKRRSRKALEQADISSSSEEDEDQTPAYMERQPRQRKRTCISSSSQTPSSFLSVKKRTRNVWTQTYFSDILDDDEVDIRSRKKGKKINGKTVGMSSNTNTQTSRRLSKGTQSLDRVGRPRTKAPSQRREETQKLRSSSSSDSETSSASLSTHRQTTKAKNVTTYSSLSKSTSNVKNTDKLSPAQARRKGRSPQEHLSHSTPDMKSPRSSKKNVSEKVQKHSHSSQPGGTAAKEDADSKQERITQEYDNFILDISSVPLPSETPQPRKAFGSSENSKTGKRQAAAGGAHLTEDDPQKLSIDNFSSLTSQNRILKQAWQSTVSSGSSKKEDHATASHQQQNPVSASSQLPTSKSEPQQAKHRSMSPGKSLGGRQESRSEPSAAPSTREATLKEARTDSGLAARADRYDKKPVRVKVNSKARPLVLTKKVSLSSGSSEEGKLAGGRRKQLGKPVSSDEDQAPVPSRRKHAGKRVRPAGSRSRHSADRRGRQEDEEETQEQQHMSKSAMDRPRTKGQMNRNSGRALKTSMSGKQSRPTNMMTRADDRRSALEDRGDEIYTQENVHQSRMGKFRRPKEIEETVTETTVQDNTPAKHSRFRNTAGRLDDGRHNQKQMEEDMFAQRHLHELTEGKFRTQEGKVVKSRFMARTGVPSRPSRSPGSSNRMEAARARPQEGEAEICEQHVRILMMKKSGTRQGTEAMGGTAVRQTTPGKPTRRPGTTARPHPNRSAPRAAQEESQGQHNIQEPLLTKSQIKQEQDIERRLALRKRMLEQYQSKPCRPGQKLNICKLETEDEPPGHQTVPRQKMVRVRPKGQQETTRGTAIKSCIPVKRSATSGIIRELVARRYRPKERESELCGYADVRGPRMASATAGQVLRGMGRGVKHEASGSYSAASNTGGRVGACRPGLVKREDEDDGCPDVGRVRRRPDSRYGTSIRDSVSDSSSASEMSDGDAVSRKSGDELERKLREKLLRCLQAKRTETTHDQPETSHDQAETMQDMETVQDVAETADDRPETDDEIPEKIQDTAESPQDIAETSQDIAETADDRPETADDTFEPVDDTAEVTQDRSEMVPDGAETSIPSPAAGY